MRLRVVSPFLVFAVIACGCSKASDTCSGPCSPPPGQMMSGPDASAPDAGAADLAMGPQDAAMSGPADLRPCCDLANPAGPWPTADVTLYGAAQGLSGTILDSSADDAQNIWAASADTLYVLRPGQTMFQKFTAADGLHIQPFTDPDGNPAVTNITAVAGGHANEAFVGYYGYESDNRLTDTVANEKLGQADKITLNANGTIAVLRYEFRCDHGQDWCWENRSVRRMLFAHQGVAAGHLFIGFDHGVSHVFNDHFGDHIHCETWYHYPDGHTTEKIGEQYGLALFPNGDLLEGSAYCVGRQMWSPDPPTWVDNGFTWAFTTYDPSHSLDVAADYREDQRGAAITPDGVTWFASITHGLASWDPKTGNFGTIKQWSAPGLPSSGLMDMVADLDGTLWIVTIDGQLLRFNPATSAVTVQSGLGDVRRVVLDGTVTPRALYVSLGGGGLAVIRAK
ncbi:MAG TPA: hypothetical protein VFF06_25045 [Polyangia bacterium]|nr:hypothetical protein [Polyangia bacterium]